MYVDSNGRWTANLANDGSRESNGEKDNKAQCWGSEFETNPWWAVDLGRPTTIYRVDFTNRGDNAGTYNFVPCLTLHRVQSGASVTLVTGYIRLTGLLTEVP